MPGHRSRSVGFERQVVAEYHAGESLHALARRHDLSRNLIRIWVEKAEAGALDQNEQDVASAELLTVDRHPAVTPMGAWKMRNINVLRS